MNLDTGIIKEQEEKKKRQTEKEKKKELERVAKQQERKEKIHQEEVTHEELSHLKDLLEHHEIDDEVIKKVQEIAKDDAIDSEEMKEIFEMIEDFENSDDEKKYIPDELHISRDEYAAALHDEEQRSQVLKKLDTTLGILADHASPGAMRGLNIIGGLSMILDKNLIVVQEKHIDIKRSLEEKDGVEIGGFWSQVRNMFRK